MKTPFLLIAALSLLTLASTSFAEEAKKKGPRPQNIPLFQTHDVLKVTIQGDFPNVNKASAPQNMPSAGKLSYSDGEKEIELDIQLEARGGGRSWWCSFGPMKLILGSKEDDKQTAKKKLKGTIFNNSRRQLRLVTHCKGSPHKPSDDDWDKVVLTEHALFRVLQASPFPSLQTRLAYAEYVDLAGNPFASGYLLFLENAEDMADRYGLTEVPRETAQMNLYKLSEPYRVPYEMSLQLIDSKIDHDFRSERNCFVMGPKLENGEFDYNESFQVPYDFVYTPANFPYSKVERPYPVTWLKAYASQFPAQKEQILLWTRLLGEKRADIHAAIASVPYPEGSFQPLQVRRWIDDFFADLDSFLEDHK